MPYIKIVLAPNKKNLHRHGAISLKSVKILFQHWALNHCLFPSMIPSGYLLLLP